MLCCNCLLLYNDNGIYKKVTQFQVNYSNGTSRRSANLNKTSGTKVISNSVLRSRRLVSILY